MTVSGEGEHTMNSLESIKSSIEELFKTNPNIHISVKIARPKLVVEKTPAVITVVYKNIFQIEENHTGCMARHTIQYVDVLVGIVVIDELDYIPEN